MVYTPPSGWLEQLAVPTRPTVALSGRIPATLATGVSSGGCDGRFGSSWGGAVGLDHSPGLMPAVPLCRLQRVDDQLGADVVGDGPADDAAGEDVEHRAAVHLALGGGVLGDVGASQAVRGVGVEPAADQFVVHHRCGTVPALVTCTDAGQVEQPHQPGDALAPDSQPGTKHQLGVYPWGAVAAAGAGMRAANRVGEVGVLVTRGWACSSSSAASSSSPPWRCG